MIRKQSEFSNYINSLISSAERKDYRSEMAERQPEMKQFKKAEKDRSWATEKGYEKTKYNDPISRNASSVRPARCDSSNGISDVGGPSKHVGVSGKNTIFDPNVLEKIAQQSSSKEKTEKDKATAQEIRTQKQAEYKSSISPKLGDSDVLSSKSQVQGDSIGGSSRGITKANVFSIFDTNENFDRLSEMQNRVSPKIKEESKQKGVSKISKTLSSNEIQSNFLNNLSDSKESVNHKNLHRDAVSRLYEVLKSINPKGE